MKARFFSSVLPAALAIVFLACSPAWCDVIVLLDGRTIQGTLADREEFARDPHAYADVVVLVDAGRGSQPQLRRVAVEGIDFVVLEVNGERRVVDVRGGAKAEARVDATAPLTAVPRFPYTEGPSPAKSTAQGPNRLGTGAALLLLGAATTIAGAVIQFDSWGTVAWTSGSVASSEVHYDTRNYIVMGIGGAVMVTGLVLIANSGRPGRSLALEFAGDQPVLAYRTPF